MIGTHPRIVVSLTTNRLRGAVVRGRRVVRAEEVEVEPALFANAWEQGLVPLDRPLRHLFTRLSNARATPRVTLIHHGARTVAQTHELPGSPQDARRAAIITARDAHGPGSITEGVVLAPSARKPGHSVVLTLTDREQDTGRCFAWVNRCGGRLEVIVPEVGAVVRAAAARVTDSDDPESVCYIGANWSAIACGSSDGLILIRAFEFGCRNLADVFHRALAASPEDPNAGEAALFEHGLPFKSTQIDANLRARVLPLVAPVLQRFCVEVKQTLRFGVPADSLPSVITIDGPGAAIPQLAASLTETINMHVRPAPGSDAANPLEPFGVGTLERGWLTTSAPSVGVVPPAIVEQRAFESLRCGLMAGVVAGAAALGAEYAHVWRQTTDLAPQFERHAPALAALTREEDVRARIVGLASTAGAAAKTLVESAGPRIDWAGALALVAESAGGSVAVENIEARTDASGGELNLRGVASSGTDAEAADAVAALVQSFQQSPMVAEVRLGAVGRDSDGSGQARRSFLLTLRLRPIEPEHAGLAAYAARLAAAEGR